MTATRRKVVLAFSSLAVVIVAALVAVVAVFAARNVTIKSGYTITYTALHVKATVSGTYQLQGDASATSMNPASLEFTGAEATESPANVKQFTGVTVALTETKQYVDFVYTIANGNLNAASVTLVANPDAANDNLTYTYTVKVGSGEAETKTVNTENFVLVNSLAINKTATITVHVAMDSADASVNASGEFAFVLTGLSE